MRMRLSLISNSRPDCLFEIAELAQITEIMFDSSKRDIVKRLNKIIKLAINNRSSLKIRKLKKQSIRIIEFSDSSFANNADLSSQLGHIVFLGDESDNVVPI